jgi:hypothetical protein
LLVVRELFFATIDAGKLEAAIDYAASAMQTDMAAARLLPKFRHT